MPLVFLIVIDEILVGTIDRDLNRGLLCLLNEADRYAADSRGNTKELFGKLGKIPREKNSSCAVHKA